MLDFQKNHSTSMIVSWLHDCMKQPGCTDISPMLFLLKLEFKSLNPFLACSYKQDNLEGTKIMWKALRPPWRHFNFTNSPKKLFRGSFWISLAYALIVKPAG
jgi:hypothetical protein